MGGHKCGGGHLVELPKVKRPQERQEAARGLRSRRQSPAELGGNPGCPEPGLGHPPCGPKQRKTTGSSWRHLD